MNVEHFVGDLYSVSFVSCRVSKLFVCMLFNHYCLKYVVVLSTIQIIELYFYCDGDDDDEACGDGDVLDQPFPKSTYSARTGIDKLETILGAVGCPSGWSD